ncbi:MAG: hypothetical protein ABI779_13800 [Acidobacteriota bacterium]
MTTTRILGALALSFAFALPGAAMTVTVDAEGVTAAELPRGARIVLFGVGREPGRYRSSIRRWTEVLADDDRDGRVRFAGHVTNRSIWVAVDLETGESVAATGPDYPRREVTAGSALKRDNVGQLSKLENARGIAEMLIVRPKRGAWRLGSSKNSAVDEARGNPAVMRLDASAFRAVEGVASDDLKHLKRGDVLAMIDPRLMEFYVIHVNED